ncbi:SDR family NAD(P)-dependent oxidoreductase [Pseudonocardia kujensis]|uniref:SDR family NAD(P)-dependent oxidoreductase n=1 Tax=Pseudonocardia kujensis TaxID=1128675 RepID=UPI001E608A72|nr:SDR family NAD(P)-dependent oxidoreductase [Pseudonocardia kujensis]MCE0762086.1 SDR family NAD(P)-dependent oxidoreductase [Pseudonocardia kujensis]
MDWFITGVSRGLGRSLALAALDRGHTVVGTTRSGTSDIEDPSGRLHVLPLDLADPDQPAMVAQRVLAMDRDIDVVVNNAGYGLLGPVEEVSDVEAGHLFRVNFFGAFQVLREMLPHLRARGRGHLINVSSIAALDPLPGSGVYAAAKAALTAMSEALATELAPFNITVTSVEPGAFRTQFLSEHSVRYTTRALTPYEQAKADSRAHFARRAGCQPGDPDRAARLIIDAITAGDPPVHLVLGADAMDRTRRRTQELLSEIDRWSERSAATAFPQ